MIDHSLIQPSLANKTEVNDHLIYSQLMGGDQSAERVGSLHNNFQNHFAGVEFTEFSNFLKNIPPIESSAPKGLNFSATNGNDQLSGNSMDHLEAFSTNFLNQPNRNGINCMGGLPTNFKTNPGIKKFSAALAERAKSPHQNGFLHDLFKIVSEPNNQDIISWLPHGRGFIITNKAKFEKTILPDFLPNTKYASFTRRLKRWQFSRVPSGAEMGSYYHPYFQRGKPQLVSLITTGDSPSIDPSRLASSSMSSHKDLYASMRASHTSQTTHSDGTPISDVRDFPQIMRDISKAKRLESIATRRRREAAKSYWDDGFLSSSFFNQPLEGLPPSPTTTPLMPQQNSTSNTRCDQNELKNVNTQLKAESFDWNCGQGNQFPLSQSQPEPASRFMKFF